MVLHSVYLVALLAKKTYGPFNSFSGWYLVSEANDMTGFGLVFVYGFI